MATDAAGLDTGVPSRALVAGSALLLVGDAVRADRLTQTVLARAATGTTAPPPLATVLAALVRPRAGDFEPPWVAGHRVELRDEGPGTAAPSLLTELQRLPAELRTAVVLVPYAGLSPAEAATVLGADPSKVEQWVGQAQRELAALRPDRLQPGRLAEELRSAAGHAVVSGTPATDRAHGRALVRRRRLRGTVAVAAALLVLVLGAVTVLDRGPAAPEAASTPGAPVPTPAATSTGPEPVTAACDIRNPSCQATVMRRWRAEMSAVVTSYLDPEGTYFTGYSFSYDPRYESPAFWSGGEGALGLEVFRLKGGATEVYVQVATGYGPAVRCGTITGRRCEGQRFRDGNRFTLSTTSQLARGIEVQHRPDGDQVVTVVARNTTRGRTLDVTRADLIELVQDPRLRLPVI